jgi:hypothetical protein
VTVTFTLAAPPAASPIAEDIAAAMDWTYRSDGPVVGSDVGGALAMAGPARAVMIVPPDVEVSSSPHCLAVLHDGTPGASVGVHVAERAADRLGTKAVVVVHAAERELHADHGSLPALRLADHEAYDWEDWRQEFLRRFCSSPALPTLRLEVVSGPPVESILDALGRDRVDLVIATWKGDLAPDRARVLRAVAQQSPAPVLILLEGDEVATDPSGGPRRAAPEGPG